MASPEICWVTGDLAGNPSQENGDNRGESWINLKAKIIPILENLPDISFEDLKYWCFNPVQGEVIIICRYIEYQVRYTKTLEIHQILVADNMRFVLSLILELLLR